MEKLYKFGRDLKNEVTREVLTEETLRKDIRTVCGKTLNKEISKELCGETIRRYKAQTEEAMNKLLETEEVSNMTAKLAMIRQKAHTKLAKMNNDKSYDEMAQEMDNPGKLIYGVTRDLLMAHKERLAELRDELKMDIKVNEKSEPME